MGIKQHKKPQILFAVAFATECNAQA